MSLQHGEWWIDDGGHATFADGDIGDQNHESIAFEHFIGLDEDALGRINATPDNLNLSGAADAFLEDNDIDERFEDIRAMIDDTDIDAQKEFAEKYNLHIEFEQDEYTKKYGSLVETPELPWDKNPKGLSAFETAFRDRFNVNTEEPDLETALAYSWFDAHGANMDFVRWMEENNNADIRDYAIEHKGWIRVHDDNFQFWKLDDDTLSNIQSADLDWADEDDSGVPLDESQEEVFLEENSTNKTWHVPVSLLLSAPSAEGLKNALSGARKLHREATDEEGFSAYNPVQVKADDFYDPEELAKGIEVEKEHTNDPDEARIIAKQHLEEIPDYYTRLVKMERQAREETKDEQEAAIIQAPDARTVVALKDIQWPDVRLRMKKDDWVVVTSGANFLVWRWHEGTQLMIAASDIWLDAEPSDGHEPSESEDTVTITEMATNASFTVPLYVLLDPNLDAFEVKDEARSLRYPQDTPGQIQDWREHLGAVEDFRKRGEPLPGEAGYDKFRQKLARGRRASLKEA